MVAQVANTRRTPSTRGGLPQARAAADDAVSAGPAARGRRDDTPRLPPVRLAPREELAHAARVAPLLRAARDLARWAETGRGLAAGSGCARRGRGRSRPGADPGRGGRRLAGRGGHRHGAPAGPPAAAGPGHPGVRRRRGGPRRLVRRARGHARRGRPGRARHRAVHGRQPGPDGEPVRRPRRRRGRLARRWAAGNGHAPRPRQRGHRRAAAAGTGAAGPDQAAVLSWALETLADLGVVELGTDEDDRPAG